MSNSDTNKSDSPAGIDFLDFLFTLAISVGLSPGILGIEDRPGLLSEDWFKLGVFPSGQALYDLFVFGLGFLTLTLSWFGYHGSIRQKPLKYGTLSGMFRFVVDVLLVVIYGVILLEYKRFGVVLLLLLIVHFIFVIWDVVKVIEHRDQYKRDGEKLLQVYRREFVSGVVFVAFLVLWCLRSFRWPTLILAIFLTVFYRINKEHALWERLFGVKTNATA